MTSRFYPGVTTEPYRDLVRLTFFDLRQYYNKMSDNTLPTFKLVLGMHFLYSTSPFPLL